MKFSSPLTDWRARRTFLAKRAALLLVLAAVLAGAGVACGDDDDDAGSGGDGQSDAAAFPVTVSHRFGSTTIESEPERVVSLGFNDQDPILAFGVKPVAIRYWYGDFPYSVYPWAQDELGDATPEVIELDFEALDIETVAALDPDLIIAVYSGLTQQDYDRLTEIAPTVAQSGEYIDFGMPWEETTQLVRASLGQRERADDLVHELEAAFEQAQEDHPEFVGANVIVASMQEGGFTLFATEDGRTRVMTSLGFQLPGEVEELFADEFYFGMSDEQMAILETADVVVWTQVVFTGGRHLIEEHPIYSKLRVAQEGRHVFLEGLDDDAFAFNSVLSLPYVLETFIPQLEAALDGDPATEAPGRGPAE